MSRQPPSFDLVVATVGRTDELARLLASLEGQKYAGPLRVIVVDQNADDGVASLLEGRTLRVEHLRTRRGLSHARNAALDRIEADVVAFPDDDCIYPDGTLDRVAARFADPELSGITGRAEDENGASSPSWKPDAAVLTDDNLWNRAISFTMFLRAELVREVGRFDERLGLGSREPWSSGEETDYLIRAVKHGARIEYDPTLVIRHDVREDDARVGARDGASVGFLLRKHGYPARVVTRMLIRPLGGFLVACIRLDRSRARYQLATLGGRIRGYRGASRANSSA